MHGIGIIGAGSIAQAHMRAAAELESTWLAAAADTNPERLAEARAAHGCQGFDDYRNLLASGDVDIAIVCTPHGLHCEQTVAALEAGGGKAVGDDLDFGARIAPGKGLPDAEIFFAYGGPRSPLAGVAVQQFRECVCRHRRLHSIPSASRDAAARGSYERTARGPGPSLRLAGGRRNASRCLVRPCKPPWHAAPSFFFYARRFA